MSESGLGLLRLLGAIFLPPLVGLMTLAALALADACPKALLPKLSQGVKPTKVDGTKCFYQTVEVACP